MATRKAQIIGRLKVPSEIRAELSNEDFEMLMEVADGGSYAEIACDRGLTISNLKSKVLRARNKVRNGPNAAELWRGLHR